MKKFIAFMTVALVLTFSFSNLMAQNVAADTTKAAEAAAAQAVETGMTADQIANAVEEDIVPEGESFNQMLKTKFIEGGPAFMGIVLVCLILGLAFCIERVVYLNLSETNTKKLLVNIEAALKNGGVAKAKEVCKNTRGPVASIFWQGLDRMDEGMDNVEKSMVSYGGVMMGRLEKNLSWIALFIALGPMLGFMGTVIGMIGAFDAIEAAGDISPTVVASGIKVALLTTVFGLIVAIVLQIFYNYCLSKIDSIVNDMEDGSISFIDMLFKFQSKK